jgi:hypothetical protein
MSYETSNYPVLLNSVLTTSNATLFTSSDGDGVRGVWAINGTGSSATVSVTVVRKGGTATDTEAVVLAAALPVPANSATNLTASLNLTSEYGELLLETGDYLYGEASAGSAITLIVIGS